MAFQDLPGFSAQFRDGGLTLAESGIATNSILLLGTSLDGPKNKPIAITRLEDAVKIFGNSGEKGNSNGTTLVRGLYEAYLAGCRDIRLMRITGETASVRIQGPSDVVSVDQQKNEIIGTVSGNNQLLINMSTDIPEPSELIPGSVKITANGANLLPTMYSINYNAKTITIPSNVTDSNANIVVYYEKRNFEDVVVGNSETGYGAVECWNSDGQHKVYRTVDGYKNLKEGTVKVYKNDEEVENGFTIDLENGKVTFDVALTASDVVTMTFTYVKSTDVTEVSGEPLKKEAIATGSNQVLKLGYLPIADPNKPFVLSAGGSIINSSAYYINYETGEVILRPGNAKLGHTLEAKYWTSIVTDNTPVIYCDAVAAGTLYNGTKIRVTRMRNDDLIEIGMKVEIVKPVSKKLTARELNLTFTSLDYPTFGDLANAVNNHPLNNVITMRVPNEFLGTLTENIFFDQQDESNEYILTGGDDGLDNTADELYDILGGVKDDAGNVVSYGIYDLLLDYPVDIVVPLGVYADDELSGDRKGFAEQLANFCARCSLRNSETRGVISVRPLEGEIDLVAIHEHFNYLMNRNNSYFYYDDNGDYYYDTNGSKLDVGRYIDVTVCQSFYASDSLGTYKESFATSYAGLMSSLAPENATTNKIVPNSRGLAYQFSNDQLLALSNAHYVCFQNKAGRGVCVVDGVTAALEGSDWSRNSTCRIANAAVKLIRAVSDPFIGQGNDIVRRTALATEIDHALASMKKAGALQDYRFEIVNAGASGSMTNIIIRLTIVPVFEIRNITLIVSLRRAI